MRRLRWWLVPVVLVLVVLGLDGEAFAGTLTQGASPWSFSTSTLYWYGTTAKGETSGDLPASMNLGVTNSAASSTSPVPAQGHAECGDVFGRVKATWDGAVTSLTGVGSFNIGTISCPAAPDWLLHVWVTSGGSTVLEWKSRLIYPGPATDPLCPSDAPAGVQCVWSINATASPAAAASASAVPCPTDVTTSYPCMYAINEGSAVPASPLDLAPVSASVDTLRASAVFGICLVLFLLGAALVIRARRSR